ncbi:hypothetical protein Scep_023865 [Stephania cephalantha]|uniref:Uncharacterized protein n=1 Tax=Stephania cephalantha TaxID=152367 RepID=A0AAP0EVG0_9MAGN
MTTSTIDHSLPISFTPKNHLSHILSNEPPLSSAPLFSTTMDSARYRFSQKQKPRLSLSLSHLFRKTLDRKRLSNSTPNSPTSRSSFNSRSKAALTRSATVSWARSRADERFLSLLCGSRKGRGRTNSDDFKYDPLTYSLNFDERNCDEDEVGESDDGVPMMRSFSARLPASPKREVEEVAALAPVAVVGAEEISALS